MGTDYAPLLTDLVLYSYEADFIQGLLKKNEKKLTRSFNFTFRYIDDILLLNNSRFRDFVDRSYPIELEIKDTTDTDNKYVVNQKLEHADDISVRELFSRIRVFCYRIRSIPS
jgi:uncharacterized protein (DUF1697 family)